MSQAQKNQEQSARVPTVPPALPGHSHIAALAQKARSTPPPPPSAAYRRLPPTRPEPAPRLSVPVPKHLAIVPLWDDASLPLRPATKPENTRILWIGSTTVSLAVGALIAASLMTIRIGDYNQILPHGQNPPVAPAQAQLAAAAPAASAALPVQVFETDEPMAIELSELEEEAPALQPILIPELTVTSSAPAKAAEQVKVAPPHKAPKQRGKRGRTMPAAISASQPDPQAESVTEAEAQPEPESTTSDIQTTDVTAASLPAPEAVASEAPVAAAATEAAAPGASATEAEQPVAAAPEVVEPAAPALPEKLTRDQVRSGLDSVRAKVLACTNGSYGTIHADVTISAPGKVSSAVIEGTFAGTKAADCMTQKISNAKFAAFSGPDISVRYPYSF